MGLKFVNALSLSLIWLLQTATSKLVYVNGVQQKDLTPVKPHEIDGLVQLLKQVASAEPEKGFEMPSRNQTESSDDSPQVSKLTNDTGLVQGGPGLNLTTTEIRPKLNDIRQQRGVGATFDFVHAVWTLLKGLQKNVSKPNFFVTNFASKHTDETD